MTSWLYKMEILATVHAIHMIQYTALAEQITHLTQKILMGNAAFITSSFHWHYKCNFGLEPLHK